MTYRKIFQIACIIAPCAVFAQRTAYYTHPNASLEKALNLYHQKQYKASQYLLLQQLQQVSDASTQEACKYYIASAAIHLGQTGANDQMEQYLKEYPASPYATNAYLQIGDYYFTKGDTKRAIAWYDKVHIGALSASEKEKFSFQYGYALFAHGDKETAQQYLSEVQHSKTYGKKAAYYLGYIAYDADDYQKANEFFQQVGEEKELNKNLSYYQADMNFKQGNFQKSLEEGLAQLKKATQPQYRSEINKIIGESYFNLKAYDKALPYLEAYKGKDGKYTNTDLYYLGYAYYKQGDYLKAIGQFNQIIDGKNQVAQNAYYHLAECYLKTDQKQQALNAFRNASQMDFSDQIKKDAHLNYARLSYEIGNAYESTPVVIQSYLDTYPGDHTQELRELLVDSYITSGNFREAITLLDKNSSADDKTYQKVAFFYALQLYSDGLFQEALTYFQKAQGNSDALLKARATYWAAETHYQLHHYKEAQKDFQDFLKMDKKTVPEYANAYYGLGYTLFNQKEYALAAESFTKYIAMDPPQPRLTDAYLRQADSYFATGKYWPALEAYDRVVTLHQGQMDYASFQKAISYGIVDRVPKKIEELTAFIKNYPESNLCQDAIYELANTYVSQGNTEKATSLYQQLQTQYKEGTYTARAMLREGLMFYNKNQNQKALDLLKKITEKFPNTPEALQAVSTAKNIYVEMGKVEEYASWAKKLGYVNVSDNELETAAFEAAERKYLQHQQAEAKVALEKYIKEYPQGINLPQARFYLAQLYYEGNEKAKARPLYERILQDPRNEYAEQVLVRLSNIYLEKGENQKVLPLLQEIENTTSVPQNTIFARSNLMKIYYQEKQYPQVIIYAKKLLAEKNIDNRLKSDAQVMIARSYIATGNEAEAEKQYALLKKTATDALMAETLYYEAYFKNKAGQYKKSNEVIQKLAKEYGGYKEFSAKGLVVMAKNFYGLKDLYQANYILNSVVENFKDYPEVVAQAKETLTQIKSQENKNSK